MGNKVAGSAIGAGLAEALGIGEADGMAVIKCDSGNFKGESLDRIGGSKIPKKGFLVGI